MKTIAFHLNCLERGGAERVVVNLSNRLVKDGYRVLIATEYFGKHEYTHDPAIERIHVGLKEEDEGKGRLAKYLLRIRYLKDFLRDTRPDVVVTFSHKADYRALMAAKGTGVPVVVAIRTNPAIFYDHFLDRQLVKRLFPRARGIVYQTTGQKEFFDPYMRCPDTIILNPIDPKYYAQGEAPVREKRVVHHARLVYFKNQPMLIRAFLRMRETHPDYVLHIYGEDSGDGTKEQLEALIKERQADDCVFLMGGDMDFEKVIPQGAIYAFPSDWEGMPNALLEAMAMGMPVVATDCPAGGPRTVIRNEENGLLIPVGDEDALTQALTRLADDRAEAERLGLEARNIRAKADPDVIYLQWVDFLKKAVNES